MAAADIEPDVDAKLSAEAELEADLLAEAAAEEQSDEGSDFQEEEKRLAEERREEERKVAAAAKPAQKLTGAREREKVKSLNKLLSQSSMYADFLSQKLPQMVKKDSEPDAKRAKTNSTNADFFRSDLVKEELRGYQKEGVLWLRSLYENGLHGILADEMGLGKTVQIIAFLAHLKAHKSWGPVLIIGPLSVLSNWDLEITRWTGSVKDGGLEHYVYHGDKKSREEMRAKYFRSSRSMNNEERGSHPVIITSFEIAMADAKFLLHTNWFYLVVDEGHRLKNMNCKLIKQLKLLPTQNRLLLTGTPLQNNLNELWSLLNFLLPDIFSSVADFDSLFDFTHVVGGGGGEGDDDAVAMSEKHRKEVISHLHNILNPFLLRRLKKDVEIGLPPKRELILYAHTTPVQDTYTKAIVEKRMGEYLISQVETGEFQMNDLSSNVDGTSVRVLNMLMQLRKASNHPYLFMEPSDRARANSEMVESCGKMQLFHRLLARLKERGHRVLVFSQMSRMLDIIEDYLVLQKHSYCRIDGSVASEDRASQIADFNVKGSSIFAFLLSTRAGGLGINLWSADTCIIFDSDWNPQADLQAMDRCHRIGQTKPVCVYRLITRNSVEVKILEKAQSKRQLELLVVADGRFMDVDKKSSSKNLSSDDVNDILAAAKKMMDASGQGQSEAITDEQLDAALDRSDMMPGASGAAPAGKKKKAAAVKAGGFEILE